MHTGATWHQHQNQSHNCIQWMFSTVACWHSLRAHYSYHAIGTLEHHDKSSCICVLKSFREMKQDSPQMPLTVRVGWMIWPDAVHWRLAPQAALVVCGLPSELPSCLHHDRSVPWQIMTHLPIRLLADWHVTNERHLSNRARQGFLPAGKLL